MIAAVGTEHGCTIATLDQDFARFPSAPHTLLPGREDRADLACVFSRPLVESFDLIVSNA